MKKLHPMEKIRFIKLSNKRFKKRISRKQVKMEHHLQNFTHTIQPPEELSFDKINYKNTVEFFMKLREIIDKPRAIIKMHHINIKNISKISIAAGIVLASEIQRNKELNHFKIQFSKVEEWKKEVKELFIAIGIFDLLDVKRTKHKKAGENIFKVKIKSGKTADGEKINDLQSDFINLLGEHYNEKSLYEGMAEAIENVISHAYPSYYKFEFKHINKWWAAACFNKETNTLHFFVYDQGAGIPETIHQQNRTLWRGIKKLLTKGGNDGEILKLAFEYGKTSTGELQRGLGLQKIWEVVRKTPGSRLRILSGQGGILLDSEKCLEITTHATHIGGTLIEWRIPALASQTTH